MMANMASMAKVVAKVEKMARPIRICKALINHRSHASIMHGRTGASTGILVACSITVSLADKASQVGPLRA